jgi:hypothetical protein
MPIFSWRKPECPIGFREKAWVETRMRWLGEQFGAQRLTRCKLVLPTEDDLPGALDGTPEAARQLLDCVCRCMDVPPSQVQLHIQPPDAAARTPDQYEPGTIYVAETQLANPVPLIAALAHDAAHHVMTQRKLLENEPDREWLTDLATVIFGLGIFTANATIVEKHERTGRRSWNSVSRQSYLPARVTAYAMAVHVWLSGERKPDWGGYLRDDAREAFGRGLQFLEATEDSLLRPDNIHSWDKNPSTRKLLGQLKDGSPAERVVALSELARRTATPETVQAVTDCLADRLAGLRAEALHTLAQWGAASEPAMPAIVEALDDSDEEVRLAAASALGRLGLQADTIVPALVEQLDNRETMDTAAWALAQFKAAALSALPRLLARLAGELVRGDGAMDYLTYAIRAIAPDPEAELERLIESCDPEVQQQAAALLPESGPIADPPGLRGLHYWTGDSAGTG